MKIRVGGEKEGDEEAKGLSIGEVTCDKAQVFSLHISKQKLLDYPDLMLQLFNQPSHAHRLYHHIEREEIGDTREMGP